MASKNAKLRDSITLTGALTNPTSVDAVPDQIDFVASRSDLSCSTHTSQDDHSSTLDDTDDGGMTINIDAPEPLQQVDSIQLSDSDHESDTVASNVAPAARNTSIQQDPTQSSAIEVVQVMSSSSQRLADLNPDDLESQLKYAFYHLDRSQIDLTRLAICLRCNEEGHIDSRCPEQICRYCGQKGKHLAVGCPENARCEKCREFGHSSQSCKSDMRITTVSCSLCGSPRHTEASCIRRFFPPSKLDNNSSLKLWISCCKCASRSHLVGDCPYADRSTAARWSLKFLDPQQITNLSLETTTIRRQREAENRGMRPEGLQIKGRASLHHAGGTRSEPVSGDDDEPFIRPRVGRPRSPPNNFRFGPQGRDDSTMGTSQKRYDRFEAPTDDLYRPNLPRNEWYGTDSFGRRRSRSPGYSRSRYVPSYRSEDDRNRRPSPPRSQGPRHLDQNRRGRRSRSPPARNTLSFDSGNQRSSKGGPPPPTAKTTMNIKIPPGNESSNWSSGNSNASIKPSAPTALNNSNKSSLHSAPNPPQPPINEDHSTKSSGKPKKRNRSKNKNHQAAALELL